MTKETSNHRADSRFAPSQCEIALLCNDVSHWLGASLDSALKSDDTACEVGIFSPWDVASCWAKWGIAALGFKDIMILCWRGQYIYVSTEIGILSPHSRPEVYNMLVAKFEKTPPFRGFWTKKHPFFKQNLWFWGPIKHPLFKQSAFFFRSIRYSTLFMKVNNCIKLKTCFYVRRVFHYF